MPWWRFPQALCSWSFWKSAIRRCRFVPPLASEMHVSWWWHGLAFVPTVQDGTIFTSPELLFTQANVSARAADAPIAIKPRARQPAINVLISKPPMFTTLGGLAVENSNPHARILTEAVCLMLMRRSADISP